MYPITSKETISICFCIKCIPSILLCKLGLKYNLNTFQIQCLKFLKKSPFSYKTFLRIFKHSVMYLDESGWMNNSILEREISCWSLDSKSKEFQEKFEKQFLEERIFHSRSCLCRNSWNMGRSRFGRKV